MGLRILSVGTDMIILETRHPLLASRGYDPLIATPEDVDEKLQAGGFDLVILSVMLTEEDKCKLCGIWATASLSCWLPVAARPA
jgi:DNA-binding response OmpR family regulator